MRIYLASTTTGITQKDRLKVFNTYKPLYCLETFFNGEKICKKVLNDVKKDNFLLDSGAFSFMNGAKHTKEELLSYLDRYIKFINDNNVKYFFELDVDTIYGIKFVEDMRIKLEKETNRKCIPVWHKSRGVKYWKRMCMEYNYIAIGGLVFHIKKSEYPLIRQLVEYAYQNGVKVHGLGFTKTKDLEQYKFYSVDSTSYVKGATRGQLIHFFDGEKIIQRKLNKGNKKVILSKLVFHNMTEWIKYQKYMDRKKW